MPIPLNLVASNYRAERNIISHQTRKAVLTDIKSNQPHACLKKYIFPRASSIRICVHEIKMVMMMMMIM